MNKKIWGILIIICCGCASKNIKNNTIDFSSLLKEMTNKKGLAQFPSPEYRLMQSSSWDRAQTDPDDSLTWFANQDNNHSIREEKVGDRKEYVIMDSQGPGVITRWWIPSSAGLEHRTLRIYLDGNPEPVVFENYWSFINGSSYVKWPYAFVASDEKDAIYQYSLPVGHPKQFGADFYLPIPYAKSCKVTLDDKPFYYAINYREYTENTKILSFSKEDFDKNRALQASMANGLLTTTTSTKNVLRQSRKLAQGQSLEIIMPSGENAINAIQLNINSKENKQKNRGTVLQINFDGEETVWSPVSEFFGGGVYGRPVKNNRIEVSEKGLMISKWLMPYKKSAKVILKNYGIEEVDAELIVSTEKYDWNENSMHFHAKWHEEAPLNTPPFKDWNYVTIEGKGLYVGDVLTIHAENPQWWGEGDEKIYIDGEKFPSHLGTGLEDYYGFAWGMANFFNSPFISMPNRDARGKDNWTGYTTVSRMRHLDAIPFKSSLKLDIEAWQTIGGTSYSVTSFWYAFPGTIDNIKTDEETILRKLPDFLGFNILKSPGEKHSNPAGIGLTKPLGNRSIRQVGNHLDLLKWKQKEIEKPLDLDSNNEYGSAGYHLFGVKAYDTRNQLFVTDSLQSLPDFVKSISFLNVKSNFQNTVFKMPNKDSIFYFSGAIETICTNGEKEILSFTVGKDVPLRFRLGIMTDNTGSYDKVGEYLKIISSNGGNSGDVPLANSNRFPDWYFFDLSGMKPGEKITIKGKTKNANDIFSLGAITFDVKN